jgi:methionyl-tRNA formyltransferase
MGTKEIGFSCLKHLVDCRDKFNYEVTGVLTNDRQFEENSMSVSDLAKMSNIPIIQNLDQFLQMDCVDLVISVQYHEILKKVHLEKANRINVNLHMAPLPEYRGCNQFSFAILNEDKEFGTSIHLMDDGIDSGDIISQSRFPIPKNCFVDELYKLTVKESENLFKGTLPNLISGNIAPIPQNSFKSHRSELHYRKEINEIKEINPSWETQKLIRHIRATAMTGFPSPYMIIDRKKIKFIVEDK